MRKIYLFILVLTGFALQAQVYNMQNGSFTTCSGMFYDSGGPAGAYGSNEIFQITFCPPSPGSYIELNFSIFDVESAPFDSMTVFNGPNTASPIIGSYGGVVSPISGCGSGTIASSHASGCLTIRFVSDGSVQFNGWAAIISCVNIPGGSPVSGPPNAVCTGASPFCANAGPLEFPNISNADCVADAPGTVTSPNTCLGTAPNPAWYYLEIDNSGTLNLEIKQSTGPNGTGTGLDVDYALWGPYPNIASACSLSSATLVSCSYSTAAIEYATIPNAVTGQVYMVLITNFNGQAGYISVTQTNATVPGAGSTDCSIVCPVAVGTNPSCGGSNGFITVSGLDPSTAYNITYLDDGTPASVSVTSNASGQAIINGLNAGNYTNILTNFPGCTSAPSNVTLTSGIPPVFVSVTGATSVCSNSNAVFTLTGTPNTQVTYHINSGSNLTIMLNAGGTATVSTAAVVPTTTIFVTQITNLANGCATAVNASYIITVKILPTVTINYNGSPFCTSTIGTSPVTIAGTGIFSGGTYTSSPPGLSINSSTGAVTPSASSAGAYTVTYTIPASGGCPAVTTTANVSVTLETTASIAYPASSYCTSAPPQNVILTGTGAFASGTFSATPAGLLINSANGTITPTGSAVGTYTINYFIPGSGGCGNVAAAASSIIIANNATASISYASPIFCTSESPQPVTLVGTGAFTGGTYSAVPAGLSLNTVTGTITPSTSLTGNYTVSYTLSAVGSCPSITVTTNVAIVDSPTVSISYPSAAFCTSAGIQTVNLTGTGTFTGGAFTVSPAGLSINPATGDVMPSMSAPGIYTINYTIPSVGACPPVSTVAQITITSAVTAAISYGSPTFCKSVPLQAATLTGTGNFTGGLYSAAPAGLLLNIVSGTITPTASAVGTYTITYTVSAGAGCPATVATTVVTIIDSSTAAIGYNSASFCNSSPPEIPTLVGTGTFTGGSYSATPSGLTIDAATGTITPSLSTQGNYTITYTIPAAGGCGAVIATASVDIFSSSSVSVSYSSTTFCTTDGVQNPSLTGTGSFLNGTYSSSPAGLSIDSVTGVVTPSLSAAGSYTVTYFLPSIDACPSLTSVASVTIAEPATVSISYSSANYCTTAGAQNPNISGTGTFLGGTFSAFPAGLGLNPSTGVITPGASATGNFVITYTVPAAGSCASASATTNVEITKEPTVSISYASPSYCGNVSAESVIIIGTGPYLGGIYTASSAGLIVNAATGTITPSASLPGNYTVTYTIPAAGGCSAVSASAPVTIDAAASATIFYASSGYCTDSSPAAVSLTGNGLFAGGTFSASPAGLSLNPSTGQIIPSASTVGSYTISYLIPANGTCTSAVANTTVNISDSASANLSYPAMEICTTDPDQIVSLTGTGSFSGGTFFSSPAGLSIDAVTGTISPPASSAGNYTVTYFAAGSGGCANVIANSNIAVSAPATVSINYPSSGFCTSAPDQAVSLSGTGAFSGGTFSVSPSGLTLDSATGTISPSASSAGNYTVTYMVAGTGGCSGASANTTVNISGVSSANISYPASGFCTTDTNQSVALSGTGSFSGGTFFSSPAGLSIDAVTGTISPPASSAGNYTVTYFAAGSGGCANVIASANVAVSAPATVSINYPSSGFCTSAPDQAVSLSGTGAFSGGTFSVSPSGLTLDSATGTISPSASSAGNYTVTYMVAGTGGCSGASANTTVNISGISSANISYPASGFCTTDTDQAVALSGTGSFSGGTFSSSPAGLSIDAVTGTIFPSASSAGNYTVTYFAAGSGGCADIEATFLITITTPPTATIGYALSTICTSSPIQNVSLSGTGVFTGGTFSAIPTGLSIDASTGAITPALSSAGSYSVIYTIPATGNCPASVAIASINLVDDPTASIGYAWPGYCTTDPIQAISLIGTGAFSGGTFSSSPSGLAIDTVTGAITPSLSSEGNYVVSYYASGSPGCSAITASTTVNISETATVSLAYAASIFCSTDGNQDAVVTGTGNYSGGLFTSSPAGLTLDSISGIIAPFSSVAGNYIVTYTTPPNGSCGPVSVSATISITQMSTAAISYPATMFCTSSTLQILTLIGTGSFSGGTFTASPSGLSINTSTGAILPSASIPGTYSITYTAPGTAGCGAVIAGTSVTIVALPTVSVQYTASVYCTNVGSQPVILSGTGAYLGGTFISSSSGLTIDATNGAINPSSSTPGNYTVSYQTLSNTVCGQVSASIPISIIVPPTASIQYPNAAYCKTAAPQFVGLSGTGAFLGGAFFATPNGLSINPNTGMITPETSAAGNYVITYATPATSGCGSTTATANVQIFPEPIVIANPASSHICSDETTAISLTGISGIAFSWIATQSGVTGAADGSGDSILQSLSTTGQNPGTVIYHITPMANGCVGPTSIVTVIVHPIPVVELNSGYLCSDPETGQITNSFILNASLDNTHTFQWFLDSALISDETSNSLEAVSPGTYTVIATSMAGCVSLPATSVIGTVVTGTELSLTGNIEFADNAHITVAVNGTGTYEYQLDSGPFVSTNAFSHLAPGVHSITVRDAEGCTYIAEEFTVIGYPHYFTPNGDHIHDTWNIWSLSHEEFSVIHIFDRFGKLLKVISPSGTGWDGTYNGEPMPSSDYWFTVDYGLPRPYKTFKSHFSLKR